MDILGALQWPTPVEPDDAAGSAANVVLVLARGLEPWTWSDTAHVVAAAFERARVLPWGWADVPWPDLGSAGCEPMADTEEEETTAREVGEWD